MKTGIFLRVLLIMLTILNSGLSVRAAEQISNPETQGPSSLSLHPVQPGSVMRLAEMGQLKEAENLVDAALAAEPTSIRWHLLKADLLAHQDRSFELRKVLEAAYTLAPDNIEVLSHLAECRDIYGDDAATIYEKLARQLQFSAAPTAQVIQVLERALVTTLRDGDMERETRVEEQLRGLGCLQKLPTLPALTPRTVSTIRVPGGIRALAIAAGLPETITPDRFVRYYVDRLILLNGGNKPAGKDLVLGLKDYFRTLATLKDIGRESGNSFELTIDLKDKRSEDVLRLLGWRLKQHGRKFLLEVGVSPSDIRQQLIAAALEVDHAVMKKQLESGLPFRLTVKYETVTVVPDEAFWRERVLKMPDQSGFLLEAFLDRLPAAYLYGALDNLTQETRSQLLLAADVNTLLNHYSDLLHAYGSTLLVQNGEMIVPGGVPALPLWESLANANPRHLPEFITALLSKDNGKVLAYYHLLAGLPELKQTFMIQSSYRFNAFYKAFPFERPQFLRKRAFFQYNRIFEDLLRQLPLDPEGRIEWPGGPDVWMGPKLSRGRDGSLKQEAKRAPSSKDDDDFLLKLLGSSYNLNGLRHPQAENFLAVVRLQRHRHQPMDRDLADLLSKNYASRGGLFPYLASLPDLNAPEVALFFAASSRLESMGGAKLNIALGEFNSLLQWLILLSESGALQNEAVTKLFTLLCQGFVNAKSDADFASHSCDVVLSIVSAIQTTARLRGDADPLSPVGEMEKGNRTTSGFPATPDIEEILFRALNGIPQEVEFQLNDRRFRLNYSIWRKGRMQKILDLQRIPSLNALLAIYQDVKSLEAGEQSVQDFVDRIGALLAELPQLDEASPPTLNKTHPSLSLTQKQNLLAFLAKIKKVSTDSGAQSLPELTTQLIGLLNPQMQLALLGWVYSYYFSPHDLIVAEDPWFIRKHIFTKHRPLGRGMNLWAATEVSSDDPGGGRYLSGDLTQLAGTAGQLGLASIETGETTGGADASARMAAMQLASLRMVPWARLDEHGPRLVALKLLLGRELLVEASLLSEKRTELAEPLLELVGPRRRCEVLLALSNRDLASAFSLFSSSDLYFLADWFWQRHGAARWSSSPLGVALEREIRRKNSPQVSLLGGYQVETDGCIRPHLVHLGPYEDSEGFLPGVRLAERLSPIVLDLAVAADRLGLPVEVLAFLAEPAVRQIARETFMAVQDDWKSALQGIRSLQLETCLNILDKGQ